MVLHWTEHRTTAKLVELRLTVCELNWSNSVRFGSVGRWLNLSRSTCLRANNQRGHLNLKVDKHVSTNRDKAICQQLVHFFFFFLSLIHFRRIHQFFQHCFISFSRIIVLHYTTTIRVIILAIRSTYRRCVCVLVYPSSFFSHPPTAMLLLIFFFCSYTYYGPKYSKA